MLVDTVKGTKEVSVGGGVMIEVPGTRWSVVAEVMSVNEDTQMLEVRGEDFRGWIPKAQIWDVMCSGTFALDNAINIVGGED